MLRIELVPLIREIVGDDVEKNVVLTRWCMPHYGKTSAQLLLRNIPKSLDRQKRTNLLV